MRIEDYYYKSGKYYNFDFCFNDHLKLRDMLKRINGKFILSYNKDSYVIELYFGFYIEEVPRSNNLSKRKD